MKIILPKEHGAWAMWIAPYLIGITLTRFTWLHLVLLISTFFAYISISPFMQGLRRRLDRGLMWRHSFTYLIIALLTSVPVILKYPEILYLLIIIAPFFLINVYYVISKDERALFNDLAAMISLTSVFLASYYLGSNRITHNAFSIWLFNIAFFFGSALYVKSVFREKNHEVFKVRAKIFMLLLPLIALLTYNSYFFMLAFVFSMVRIFFTSNNYSLTPKRVGIIEIFNTLWFIIFITIGYYNL